MNFSTRAFVDCPIALAVLEGTVVVPHHSGVHTPYAGRPCHGSGYEHLVTHVLVVVDPSEVEIGEPRVEVVLS